MLLKLVCAILHALLGQAQLNFTVVNSLDTHAAVEDRLMGWSPSQHMHSLQTFASEWVMLPSPEVKRDFYPESIKDEVADANLRCFLRKHGHLLIGSAT